MISRKSLPAAATLSFLLLARLLRSARYHPPITTVCLEPTQAQTIFSNGTLVSNATSLVWGRSNDGIVYRTVLQFDLLPALSRGSNIHSATLDVTIYYAARPQIQHVPATVHLRSSSAEGGYHPAVSATAHIPSTPGNNATWCSSLGMVGDIQRRLHEIPVAKQETTVDAATVVEWVLVGDETRDGTLRGSGNVHNTLLRLQLDHRGPIDHTFRAGWHWLNAVIKDWQGMGGTPGGGMDIFRAKRFHWVAGVDRARVQFHKCVAAKWWQTNRGMDVPRMEACRKWVDYWMDDVSVCHDAIGAEEMKK